MFFNEFLIGRQPFHGSSSDELVFVVSRARPDMELLSNVANSDAKEVVETVKLLLQRSPKSR